MSRSLLPGSPELVSPPGVASSVKLNKGQGSPPSACWQGFSCCSPGHCELFVQPQHVPGSCSAWRPPGQPGSFLQSCFPSGWLAARAGALRCSSPAAGLCISLPLLNFLRFLSARFSSFSRFLWSPVQPLGVFVFGKQFLLDLPNL